MKAVLATNYWSIAQTVSDLVSLCRYAI